jgi:hypothetical protein
MRRIALLLPLAACAFAFASSPASATVHACSDISHHGFHATGIREQHVGCHDAHSIVKHVIDHGSPGMRGYHCSHSSLPKNVTEWSCASAQHGAKLTFGVRPLHHAHASASATSAIRSAVIRYAKAQYAGDGKTACAMLTARGRKQVVDEGLPPESGKATCESVTAANGDFLQSADVRLTSLSVGSVRGPRGSAVAKYTKPGATVRYSFVRSGGRWLIDHQAFV